MQTYTIQECPKCLAALDSSPRYSTSTTENVCIDCFLQEIRQIVGNPSLTLRQLKDYCNAVIKATRSGNLGSSADTIE